MTGKQYLAKPGTKITGQCWNEVPAYLPGGSMSTEGGRDGGKERGEGQREEEEREDNEDNGGTYSEEAEATVHVMPEPTMPVVFKLHSL